MHTYKISELNSGYFRRHASIDMVGDVANQLALVTAGNKTWIAKGERKNGVLVGGKLNGRQLAKGQFVLASYNSTNQGADVVEILGFTDNDVKYGEGGVKFASVKEVMAAKNVKTLKELEDLQSPEYGMHVHMVLRDVQTV